MTAVRRLALPLSALLAGLLATLAAALMMADAEEGRRQARFRGLADGARAAIETRMLVQLTLLRGTAGFFNASQEVTRQDFGAYVARLDLPKNYPGVLGIGYAAYARERAPLERTLADAGLSLSPRGERAGYSAILYLEPLNRLNRQALGFDMMSEATRRAAMEEAQRTRRGVLSGRVRLVQEIEPVKQPGFLIYIPLYRPGTGAFHGWVYSPLRAYDLFGAVFTPSDLREIVVEVFDRAPVAANRLYGSAPAPRHPLYQSDQPLELAGRRWTVRVSASPAFSADTAVPAPFGVAVAGVLVSLLAAWILHLQGRAARRTEEVVELRTAELRAANERLVAEGEARQAAEAKVAHMQKIEALGQLTGGIAHDFNNMLTIVIGNLDIARRRIADQVRLARAIDHATEGAQKAAELTQRLLTFGRQAPLRPSALDPDALVAGMTAMLQRTLGEPIVLRSRLGARWAICADRPQLESAILNLAINARDAMPDGGTLRIETDDVELADGDLPSAEGPARGPHVRIAVADTGHGMSPEVLERALDPFFTTKPVGKGSGLGLSQVFGFVRQSGGHLAIESVPGAGTTVSIYLPRHDTAPPIVATGGTGRAEELPRARPGETVLVVEDEDQVRAISVETLAELGYDVAAAACGPEALALLDQRPDVRLLFTDVVMPEMDGRTLATRAQALRPELKLLFTTGYTRDAIVHDGRVDADVELIQKPFTAAELARRVREVLDA